MPARKKLATQPDAGAVRRVAVIGGAVLQSLGRSVAAGVAWLLSPGSILLLLLACAGGLLVAGVNLLAGQAWAMISGAAVLFLVAFVVALGMIRD